MIQIHMLECYTAMKLSEWQLQITRISLLEEVYWKKPYRQNNMPYDFIYIKFKTNKLSCLLMHTEVRNYREEKGLW